MAKTPLVLCPGVLNDAGLWRYQIDSLTDMADCTVADLGCADSMGALADAVLAMAPPRFALAGLSMGGYVSFEILRRAPDRVLRLALLDTSARPDSEESRLRRLDLIGIAKRGGFAKIPGQLMPNLLHPDHLKDERIAGEVLAMAGRVGVDAFIRQQTAVMNRPDSRPSLSAITVPTLVAGGRQDAITTPEITGEIAAGIPGARFVIIEESGHLSPLEQPQTVAALLRYWLQG